MQRSQVYLKNSWITECGRDKQLRESSYKVNKCVNI